MPGSFIIYQMAQSDVKQHLAKQPSGTWLLYFYDKFFYDIKGFRLSFVDQANKIQTFFYFINPETQKWFKLNESDAANLAYCQDCCKKNRDWRNFDPIPLFLDLLNKINQDHQLDLGHYTLFNSILSRRSNMAVCCFYNKEKQAYEFAVAYSDRPTLQIMNRIAEERGWKELPERNQELQKISSGPEGFSEIKKLGSFPVYNIDGKTSDQVLQGMQPGTWLLRTDDSLESSKFLKISIVKGDDTISRSRFYLEKFYTTDSDEKWSDFDVVTDPYAEKKIDDFHLLDKKQTLLMRMESFLKMAFSDKGLNLDAKLYCIFDSNFSEDNSFFYVENDQYNWALSTETKPEDPSRGSTKEEIEAAKTAIMQERGLTELPEIKLAPEIGPILPEGFVAPKETSMEVKSKPRGNSLFGRGFRFLSKKWDDLKPTTNLPEDKESETTTSSKRGGLGFSLSNDDSTN